MRDRLPTVPSTALDYPSAEARLPRAVRSTRAVESNTEKGMEICRIITGVFPEGKAEESTKLHLALQRHFNEKYAKYGRWEFWNSLDGEQAYHWVERYKSLAAFEEAQAAWAADPRFRTFSDDVRGLYVLESLRTHFYSVTAQPTAG